MTAAVAVQSPGVQDRLVRNFLSRVGDKLGGDISFSSVNFQAPGSLELKDVLLVDANPYSEDRYGTGFFWTDTLAFVKQLSATVSAKMLLSGKGVHLSRVDLRGASVYLALEPDRQIKFERFIRMESKDSSATPPISVGKVYGEDIRFRMSDFSRPAKQTPPTAISYDDFDAHIGVLEARDISIRDGYVSAVADRITITEKSGADVVVSGRTKVGHGLAVIKDIHITDSLSDVRIPLYSMASNTMRDYSEYCQKVRMKFKVAKSTVASETISKFSLGRLDGMDFLLDIDGAEGDGYVSDLNISKLKFTDLYGGVAGDASLRITGITITPDWVIDGKINSIRLTTSGASAMAGRMLGKKLDFSNFAKNQPIELNGSVKGPLSKLAANAKLKTGTGTANAVLTIRDASSTGKNSRIEGTLRTKNLDVGRIIDKDFIGKVTANTGFRAVFGNDGINVQADSLIVDRLSLLGYDYTGIAAAGAYSDNAFDGKIICADPNLNFIFQGIFNLSPKTKNALYKFSANVGYADLEALHLDTRGGASKISAELNANLMKIARGDLLGDFNIYDLTLENDNGVKHIGDIYAGSHTNGDISRAQIRSSFLDAGYVGNRNLLDFFNDIQTVTTRRELPALYSVHDKDKGDASADYDISIDFHDSRDLLSFIKPGVYIADSTRIDVRMQNGNLAGRIHSPRLAYLTNYLKGLEITVDNMGGSTNATLLTEELRMGQIGFTNSALTAFAQSNEYFLSFHYDNIVGMDNVGELYLAGEVGRDATDTLFINAKPLSSYIRFNDSQWDLAESDIYYRAGEARFNNVLIYNGEQSISINGGLSPTKTDTLVLGINRVNMDIINHFTGRDYGISGSTSGRAMLSSPLRSNMKGLLNVSCDSLTVAGEDAGSLRLAMVYDKPADKVSAFLRDIAGEIDALNVKGSYRMSERNLNVDASAKGLGLTLLSPIIPEAVSGLGGTLHGDFHAVGHLDSLSLSSEGARIEGGKFTVGYTNVPYRIGGPFHIDNTGIYLDNFNISDSEGGYGVLNGGLKFTNLKDFSLDADMILRNLMLFGSRSGDVYGDLYASGDVYLNGGLDAININADLYTNKAGTMHVSLGGASSASVSDLLTFTDHTEVRIDPYELMLNELLQQVATRKKASGTNLIAHCRINATPDLEAVLELDNTGDNFLTARGNGLLNVELNQARKIFDVSGDYNISNGKYHFALPGIVSKNFNIENGSSIKFGGDIMDSELDINATYSLRTSINRLMADTTTVATRRMVNCGISITDRISSPKLGFSIDIPDLDPTTKSEVESALNSEDKIQKQFLSLVITGSFLQNEEYGIINNTNLVFSNVSEMMSRQLSNLLNRMDIPVDLGVGYQQNAEGTDLYDVSVSTELFDNRVEVRGSFGNRQYSTSNNPNGEMVGDLDIDVKLDKAGELRFNLFSHSADEYTSYLDYSQRNGVGITYQKEFGKWKDFWKSLFRGSRKRREAAAEATLSEEKRTIVIEADE